MQIRYRSTKKRAFADRRMNVIRSFIKIQTSSLFKWNHVHDSDLLAWDFYDEHGKNKVDVNYNPPFDDRMDIGDVYDHIFHEKIMNEFYPFYDAPLRRQKPFRTMGEDYGEININKNIGKLILFRF